MTTPAADDPVSAPQPLDLTGRTVGEFQVLRKIGAGGMGQVYLARQLSLKREVALKILRDDLAANPTALRRFQAEAEAVARVTHANIVQVFAVGEQDGLRYMALEFVDGRNLRDYLARRGVPDLPLALSIMRQVAAALQRASEIGIVHRDIKPENILLTRQAEVKVTDFGLSRYTAADATPLHLTQSGMTLGTPLYMSPEQVHGQVVDHRSDIYSLGVTSYHLLTGQPPFRGNTAFEVAVQHVQVEPVPLATVRPDLPSDICAIVHKMMAKRPEDRYQTARDIVRELARVQKGIALGVALPDLSGAGAPIAPGGGSTSQPVALSGSGVAHPMMAESPTVQRVRLRTIGLGGLGLGLLVVAGWSLASGWNPPIGTPPAGMTGLPTARLPRPLVSVREQELQGIIQSRATKPAEIVDAAMELGLLYVAERRWNDATKVFRDLERERFNRPGGKQGATPAILAGRLGRAIVLAHQDQAKESLALLETVLIGPPRITSVHLEKYFVSHPEFARATADAINRNADNLNLTRLPERLEWLRTPSGIVRGPRG
ncbi:MAG: serine/threonine protein kinase [Bacteroidales bacterium]|nr:serine/threonine protein kinase [Bacteroidales bacterium]